MPMTSSTASASTETTAAKLRVLLTYRGDIDTKGGAAYVMERTAKALRTVGVDAELSYETTPAVEGFDLLGRQGAFFDGDAGVGHGRLQRVWIY